MGFGGIGSGAGVPSLLLFYALAYVFLVCIAAFVLNCLPPRVTQHGSGLVVPAALVRLRLRWVWLLVITNLAGLPPAFFFGPKLGLLSLLLDGGVFILVVALGFSILLGWGAYYSLGQQALASHVAVSTLPLAGRVLPSGLAALVVCWGLFLLLGLIFLDDFFILSVWLGM